MPIPETIIRIITILIHEQNNIRPESASDTIQNVNPTKETAERNYYNFDTE